MWIGDLETQAKICPECMQMMTAKVYKNEWTGREKVVWRCKGCGRTVESCER